MGSAPAPAAESRTPAPTSRNCAPAAAALKNAGVAADISIAGEGAARKACRKSDCRCNRGAESVSSLEMNCRASAPLAEEITWHWSRHALVPGARMQPRFLPTAWGQAVSNFAVLRLRSLSFHL